MARAYLVEHPPAQRQFRERGTDPSGVIVVHTAENLPDLVGEDGSAEAVARFIEGRSDFGSYHKICDRDSQVLLVPFRMAAYGDGTGSNSHAIHISGATQAHMWSKMSARHRRQLARSMARAAVHAAKWLQRVHGVTVPPARITRAESDARVPGFITHGERDPGRRSDPGADFPWAVFFATYERLMFGRRTPLWDRLVEVADDVLRRTPKGKGRKRDAASIAELARMHSAKY